MAKLKASVEFTREAVEQLRSQGAEGVAELGRPFSMHGTPAQLRDFFRIAALPPAFGEALDQAEKVVEDHINNRGWLGSFVDAMAIAGGGIIGHPVRALMEESRPVEGYPGAHVTVIQPGW